MATLGLQQLPSKKDTLDSEKAYDLLNKRLTPLFNELQNEVDIFVEDKYKL
jgi:hypothetical protein